MPLDAALKRDLALYTLLCSAVLVPVVAPLSPGSAARSQARDLVRTLAQAAAVLVGATGAVVLGGGALLLGERAYCKVRAWFKATVRGE